jgi:ribosomal protein S18 acetylase RimI-like enzyme
VASASLTRAKSPKFSHRARIWGVFVEPAYRGRAFGKALMQAVITHARSWQGVAFLDLGVSANLRRRSELYESSRLRGVGASLRLPSTMGADTMRST